MQRRQITRQKKSFYIKKFTNMNMTNGMFLSYQLEAVNEFS